MQSFSNVRPLLQGRKQHSRRLDGGKTVTPRFATQLSVTRRTRRTENDALALQHPGIAPPQCLGLTPGPVKQHNPFDIIKDVALMVLELALAIEGDHIARRIEI